MTENVDHHRWAVVGGGILGMTLALRLAQRGFDVTLIDRSDHIGGLAGAWHLENVVWDRFYHTTLRSDRFTQGLFKELDLAPELRWTKTTMNCHINGGFHPVSNLLQALLFRPVNLVGRVRTGTTLYQALRVEDLQELETVSAIDWLTSSSGEKTVTEVWRPILQATLGENYENASAAFIVAVIKKIHANQFKGPDRGERGYVPGGYARAISKFQELLIHKGVRLMVNMEINKVAPEQHGQVRLETGRGTRITFDQVVLTVPSPTVTHMCPGLSEREESSLLNTPYQGTICSSLLLKSPISRHLTTIIIDPAAPFSAIIDLSSMVDPDELGGNHLVYLPRHLPTDHPEFETPDHEWGERAMETLTRMYRSFDPTSVLAFRVSRERHVFALPTIGFSERMPPVHTTLPGVHIVNTAQIFTDAPSVNETIEHAERMLPHLLEISNGSTG